MICNGLQFCWHIVVSFRQSSQPVAGQGCTLLESPVLTVLRLHSSSASGCACPLTACAACMCCCCWRTLLLVVLWLCCM